MARRNTKKPFQKKELKDTNREERRQIAKDIRKDAKERRMSNRFNREAEEGNDPRWHGAGSFYEAAANQSFGYQQGQKIDLGVYLSGAPRDEVIPGIQVIFLRPSLGTAYGRTDPLNLATYKGFSDLRRDKSGMTIYDAVDFTLYLGSTASVYSFITWCKRLYATCFAWSRDNAYFPRALVEAQNVDYDSLMQNLNDFRTGLNQLIASVAAYAIPDLYDLFRYHVFAYEQYYSEGTSLKDQLYMYAPEAFYKLVEDSDGAWSLQYSYLASSVNSETPVPKLTYQAILDYGWDLVSGYLNNQDMITMTGDIQTRYGSNVMRLSLLPENVVIQPQFNIGVLEQMKNTVFASYPGVTAEVTSNSGYVKGHVYQDPTKGYLISQYPITAMSSGKDIFGNAIDEDLNAVAQAIVLNYITQPKLLTTTTYQVSSDLVLDSTRMMVMADAINKNAVDGVANLTYGSLVPIFGRIVTLNDDQTTGMYDFCNLIYINLKDAANDANFTQAFVALNTAANLGNFRYHPRVAFCGNTTATIPGGTTSVRESLDLFDVDNYTVIRNSDATRIHRAAQMAELDVSGI